MTIENEIKTLLEKAREEERSRIMEQLRVFLDMRNTEPGPAQRKTMNKYIKPIDTPRRMINYPKTRASGKGRKNTDYISAYGKPLNRVVTEFLREHSPPQNGQQLKEMAAAIKNMANPNSNVRVSIGKISANICSMMSERRKHAVKFDEEASA